MTLVNSNIFPIFPSFENNNGYNNTFNSNFIFDSPVNTNSETNSGNTNSVNTNFGTNNSVNTNFGTNNSVNTNFGTNNSGTNSNFVFDEPNNNNKPNPILIFDSPRNDLSKLCSNNIKLNNIDEQKKAIILGENNCSVNFDNIVSPENIISLEQLFPEVTSKVKCDKKDYIPNPSHIILSETISEIEYCLLGKTPNVSTNFKPYKPNTEKDKLFSMKDSFDINLVKFGRVGKNDPHYTGAYLRDLAKKLGISSVGGKEDLIMKISKEYGYVSYN
jgi:hypothetical protein